MTKLLETPRRVARSNASAGILHRAGGQTTHHKEYTKQGKYNFFIVYTIKMATPTEFPLLAKILVGVIILAAIIVPIVLLVKSGSGGTGPSPASGSNGVCCAKGGCTENISGAQDCSEIFSGTFYPDKSCGTFQCPAPPSPSPGPGPSPSPSPPSPSPPSPPSPSPPSPGPGGCTSGQCLDSGKCNDMGNLPRCTTKDSSGNCQYCVGKDGLPRKGACCDTAGSGPGTCKHAGDSCSAGMVCANTDINNIADCQSCPINKNNLERQQAATRAAGQCQDTWNYDDSWWDACTECQAFWGGAGTGYDLGNKWYSRCTKCSSGTPSFPCALSPGGETGPGGFFGCVP